MLRRATFIGKSMAPGLPFVPGGGETKRSHRGPVWRHCPSMAPQHWSLVRKGAALGSPGWQAAHLRGSSRSQAQESPSVAQPHSVVPPPVAPCQALFTSSKLWPLPTGSYLTAHTRDLGYHLVDKESQVLGLLWEGDQHLCLKWNQFRGPRPQS